MVVELGDGVFLNPAQICLVSGIQRAKKPGEVFQIRIVLSGNHDHIVFGTKEDMDQIQSKLYRALEELGQ